MTFYNSNNNNDYDNYITNEIHNNFKQTKLHFNQRLKARKIFKFIDRTASKDFKNIIKASKKRCERVKSGVALDNALKQSKSTYKKITDDVCFKQLYFEKDLIKEKEKLKTNLDKEQHEDIAMLFREIRGENEIANKINEEKKRHLNGDKKYQKDQKTSKELINAYSDKDLNKGFTILNGIVDGERKKINDSISKYLSMTKTVGKDNNNKEYKAEVHNLNQSHIIHNVINNSKEVRNCLFLTRHLRLLNFNNKRSASTKVYKPKESKDVFNIKQILSFTQSRNDNGYLIRNTNNNKKNNKASDNSIDKSKYKSKLSNITQTTIDAKPLLSKRERQALNIEKLKSTLMTERSRNKNNDISETINIIKSELIMMNQSLKSSFIQKTNSIESQLNKDSLPSLERTKRQIINQKPHKSKSIEGNIIQIDDYNEKTQRPFANSMVDIFKLKKSTWLNDDINESKTITANQLKNNRMEQRSNKIENHKRFPSKFNDVYSIRDGRSNKCNEDIAELFGNHLYTKEEMTEQILRYYDKFKEDEMQREAQEMNRWKEEKETIEQERKLQRITCTFSSKDKYNSNNQNNEDIDKKRLDSLFLNYRPKQNNVINQPEDYYKDFINFKLYCERKENESRSNTKATM